MTGDPSREPGGVPRRARPGDTPELARLEALCFSPAWTEADLTEALADPMAEIWVARDLEGRLTGFALGRAVGDEAELHRVATDPDSRRRGTGRRLLEAFLAACRARAAAACWLEVRADNLAARALYEDLGFRPMSARPRYYADGTDAIVYWLPLLPDCR